ncbi:MAG: hypothetical protein ACLPUO_02740 [Streptosporangiaceae bacterium]|jgi:hypothetical protein
MRLRAAIAGLAGALALTACGSARPASHAEATPSTTPAAQVIASVAASECAAFGVVYSQVQAAFPTGTSPAGTISIVQDNSTPWNAGLTHAANDADVPGVPIGPNAARELAVSIEKTALDLGSANLDALTNNPRSYLSDLDKFLKDANGLNATCQGY